MAFDANRDIRIEASEGAAGSYTLRTSGLAGRRRPELEMTGVPEAGLKAAAGVLNIVADYTVNKAEIMADQSVGNVLTIGDEGRKLLLAVHAVASQKPSGGLWSKIAGGGKGVLRLVDVDADASDHGAPLTALSTMLVHRAAARFATEDDVAAETELQAAIALFPGDTRAGPAPSIAGADGELNWQNHLAYLDLAAISARAGDSAQAATLYGAALARSEELAQKEIGTTLGGLAGMDDEVVEREANVILERNLGAIHRGPGPSPALVTLDGEGAAAEGLRRSGAALVTKILAASRDEPWRAAWIARETLRACISDKAPSLTVGPAHAVHGLVSSVLADIARCFRAGATDDEILARYALESNASLDEKLGRLALSEG